MLSAIFTVLVWIAAAGAMLVGLCLAAIVVSVFLNEGRHWRGWP